MFSWPFWRPHGPLSYYRMLKPDWKPAQRASCYSGACVSGWPSTPESLQRSLYASAAACVQCHSTKTCVALGSGTCCPECLPVQGPDVAVSVPTITCVQCASWPCRSSRQRLPMHPPPTPFSPHGDPPSTPHAFSQLAATQQAATAACC